VSRQEHLEWCKKRAHEYLTRGDITSAMASMGSDLKKHPETHNHPAIELGVMLMLSGNLSTPEQARKFIDGFN